MAKQEKTEAITSALQLCEDVSALYLNQMFSDITFIVNGEKLHAHKVILAARCDHFKTLFREGLKPEQWEVPVTAVSLEVFQELLRFIYTGAITSNAKLILEALDLAQQYSFKNMQNAVVAKLQSILDLENVYTILNVANSRDLDELRDACHTFMDENSSKIVAEDCSNHLSKESVIKLLQRNTFFVPEVEIFKSVTKWCKANNDFDTLVIQCVRLSHMTVAEIVSIVRPSDLIDNETLWSATAEIVGVNPKTSSCRGKKLVDVNFATPENRAEVISGQNTSELLTGNRNEHLGCAYHVIDNKSNITVKLGHPWYVNHIKILLGRGHASAYSYSVEVSLGQEEWKKVVDYSLYQCQSWQDLYFEEEMVQYIRIVGTNSTPTKIDLKLVSFEAYYRTSIPKLIDGVICPVTNVATLNKNARVIQGVNGEALLNENYTRYDERNGYTYHEIGQSKIVVQFAQPYMVSTMKLLLWDKDDRSYRYFVETSVDYSYWKMVVDRRDVDCKSWQFLQFDERPVVYIRITGTKNTTNNCFHCVHLECPASSDNQ